MLDTPKPAAKDISPIIGGARNQSLSGARRAEISANRRRLLFVIILLALIAAAGASAWALFFRPINVQAARAEHDVSVQVFGLGTVEARVTSKVGFKVSGVLVDLRADVGDRVTKGAV